MLVEFDENDRDALVEDAIEEPTEDGIEEPTEDGAEEGNEEGKEEGYFGGDNIDNEEPEDGKEEKDTDEEGGQEEDGKEDVKGEEPEEGTIPVTYQDSEGNTYDEDISKEDLPAIMSVAKDGIEAIEYVREVTPIMDAFNKSKVLQDLAYYVSQGHTDEEIKKGVPQLWAKEKDDTMPEFETTEDEINYLVEKKVEKIVGPIKSKLAEEEQKRKQEEESQQLNGIESNNQNVLISALEKQGHDTKELTSVELKAIDDTFMDIYPGVDITRMKLTSKQANVIIRNALSSKGVEKARKQMSTTQKINKQAMATRSISGKAQRSRTNTNRYVPRAVPASEEERSRRVDEAFRG